MDKGCSSVLGYILDVIVVHGHKQIKLTVQGRQCVISVVLFICRFSFVEMRQKISKLWISKPDEFETFQQGTMKNADANVYIYIYFCVTRSNRVHFTLCGKNNMKLEGLSHSHSTEIILSPR
jgi:hypothetical protein